MGLKKSVLASCIICFLKLYKLSRGTKVPIFGINGLIAQYQSWALTVFFKFFQ